MRRLFFAVTFAALVLFAAYWTLGVRSDEEDFGRGIVESGSAEREYDTHNATEKSDLFPNGDIGVDEQERFKRSLESVEAEIRRTEEFLKSKEGSAVR